MILVTVCLLLCLFICLFLSLLELLLGKDLSHIKVLSFGTLSLPQLLRVSPAVSSLGAPMLMAFLFIDSIHCPQLLDPGKPVSISASPSVTPLQHSGLSPTFTAISIRIGTLIYIVYTLFENYLSWSSFVLNM